VRAEEVLEESLQLSNAAGEHAVHTLITLGYMALERGDYPRAVVLFERRRCAGRRSRSNGNQVHDRDD
jgi:hypothetical protein